MGGRRRWREARQGMHRWRRVNAWRVEGLLLQKGSDRWARRRLVRGHGKGLESASNGSTPALDLGFGSRSSTTRHLETYVFSLRAGAIRCWMRNTESQSFTGADGDGKKGC